MENISKRNNVKVIGADAETIMFAHGFGCDQHVWTGIADAFKDKYRVVLFDYVGAGCSDLAAYDPTRYSSLHGYTLDIIEICQSLSIHDAIFVGRSVSSMIGVLAANQLPGLFKKMVFLGPSGTDFTIDWRLKQIRETAVPSNQLEFKDMELSASSDAYLCFYDNKKHSQYEPSENIKALPKNVVLLEIPNEIKLDPIAVAREYGIEHVALLKENPIQRELRAMLNLYLNQAYRN